MRPPPFVNRWGAILGRTGRALYEDDCFGWAGELAFFWFLALFPALLFVVALAASLPVEHLIDAVVRYLARFAPGDVLVLVREQLVQIAQGPPRGLLTLSLLGALWSSSSAMTAVIDTLNQAYHVRETRAWWRVRLIAVGLTLVLFACTLIAMALVLVGPTLAEDLENSLGGPGPLAWAWAIAEWPLIFGLMVTALGWVYYFAPDVRRKWAWITPGAIAATLLWMLASLGFRWYAGHFGDYQKTYGAIGGVIVALLWLYATGLAILIGAEVNAAVEYVDPAGSTSPGRVPVAGAGRVPAASVLSPEGGRHRLPVRVDDPDADGPALRERPRQALAVQDDPLGADHLHPGPRHRVGADEHPQATDEAGAVDPDPERVR